MKLKEIIPHLCESTVSSLESPLRLTCSCVFLHLSHVENVEQSGGSENFTFTNGSNSIIRCRFLCTAPYMHRSWHTERYLEEDSPFFIYETTSQPQLLNTENSWRPILLLKNVGKASSLIRVHNEYYTWTIKAISDIQPSCVRSFREPAVGTSASRPLLALHHPILNKQKQK